MQRHFELKQISFDHYNELCKDKGIEPLRTDNTCRMYCEVLGNVMAYANFGEMIDADDLINLASIWFPGDRPAYEARELTLNRNPEYFASIPQKEVVYNEALVETMRKPNLASKRTDGFKFCKKNGLWTLQRFHIHERHLYRYRLDGVQMDTVNIVSAITT